MYKAKNITLGIVFIVVAVLYFLEQIGVGPNISIPNIIIITLLIFACIEGIIRGKVETVIASLGTLYYLTYGFLGLPYLSIISILIICSLLIIGINMLSKR